MTNLKLTATPSPIVTKLVSLSGKSFAELQGAVLPDDRSSDGSGAGVYLSCRDPSNQGKSAVLHVGSPSTTGSVATRVTNPTHNVRSAVHEYGGGAFCLHAGGDDQDGVIYTDFPSHVVYWKKQDQEQEQQIFPAVGTETKCRLADFKVITMGSETDKEQSPSAELLAVMEDHTDPRPSDVLNSVVTVSLDGKGVVKQLASGHDFYSSPCYDPASNRIAYVAWNHPHMPWDATTLYVLRLQDDGTAQAVHEVQSSVYSPQWFGGKLYFLSNVSGWYNLYCWDGNSTTPLLPKDADFSESSCGWLLGVKCFTFLSDGTLAATYMDSSEGSKVVLLDTKDSADPNAREFGRSCLPSKSIGCLTASGNALFFLGGSTTTPTGLWWDRPGDASCVATEVLSSMDDLSLLPTIRPFMSEPKHIKFPSDSSLGVGYAYGYFYPPIGATVNDGRIKPPLLVKAHGGPTARTSTTFRLEIQFWTSRGFAVLDVDYGGSTGYNKEYQQSLKGNWGLLDVADVCHGAQYCADQGFVNPEWLCIDGRSAGGYTTLAALVFADTFRAGASLYGVGDLKMLAESTHKFESRYLDGLIGPYPEAKSVYEARGPISHTDKLNCPVILLQGLEDKIVPPDQAEKMFEMCTSKSIPSSLVLYRGEQHGFRKAENMGHALLSEYFFFCQTFSIEPQPEDGFEGVTIGTRVEI